MNIRPVWLAGSVVRLEPLGEHHAAELAEAGRDDSIWTYLRSGQMRSEAQMLALIRHLRAVELGGSTVVFAVVHQPTQRAIGMTRFMDIHRDDRWVEIGGTWYATEFQRTAVNTETKRLLLGHAFEVLNCVRVQLKTDWRNVRSQRAIERLGAVREGVLRQHMILPDGFIRDTVMYSVLDREWPAVRARLDERLRRGDSAG